MSASVSSLWAALAALPPAPGRRLHVEARRLSKTLAGRVILVEYVHRTWAIVQAHTPEELWRKHEPRQMDPAEMDWQAAFEAAVDVEKLISYQLYRDHDKSAFRQACGLIARHEIERAMHEEHNDLAVRLLEQVELEARRD